MFGGLTKTSSRIAIAAALGLTLGGFAFKATPAQAADLGGDCCADLEERVAELEATTVRKGNKKVSVTLSGWVVKTMNFWDDGDESSFFVGDKGSDLGSRFAITGSATISPGWSAGMNITVLTEGTLFADAGTLAASNQIDESGGSFFNLYTLYSYIYIKSDTFGTLNWGSLSPASDNAAVLADISGSVIESNAVFFEGGSFFLRGKNGGGGGGGLTGLTWGDFVTCSGLGAGIGTDCFGAPQPAVRYDSPTWGGFRFETSYGTQTLTHDPAFAWANANDFNSWFAGGGPGGLLVGSPTPDDKFWDIAVFYTADWNSIKLSMAGSYTWQETSIATGQEDDLFQIGTTVMHKPSGFGIYGLYQHESTDGGRVAAIGFDANFTPGSPGFSCGFGGCIGGGTAPNTIYTPNGLLAAVGFSQPDQDAWYLKPFWRKAWSPIGATVLYGEYGQYNDQYIAGVNLCARSNPGGFCSQGPAPGVGEGVFATGSEVQRYGLGVVQEIDSAAMHIFARWQHQQMDVSLVGYNLGLDPLEADCTGGCRVKQSFDDWDLFQIGGIIFF